MRHIIIGDVHGCIQELQQLIKNLIDQKLLNSKTTLVFLGDLIHKGPAGQKVVEFVRALSNTHTVKLVIGNHEEKHIRWLRRQENPGPIGEEMKHTESYATTNLKTEDIEFIKNNGLLSYSWPGYICVHAGIPSSLKEKPTQTPWFSLSSKERKKFEKILRVRFETPEGKSVHLGEETEDDIYWADKYDGRYGHAIFGHHVFYDATYPRQFPHATGIDLGCVHGGDLVATIIENKNTQYLFAPGKEYSPIRLHMSIQP